MADAYYNECDSFAAEWLRRLILFGHIAPGEVDERSIEDVTPDDLRGFTQCHFFAGIGVWSYALRLAGWPDDRAVWTGSCPCQPFSAAGKRGGIADERHLWPAFFHLIEECRPPVVLGEQVASKDGLAWLDTVQSDLEAADYAVGATDLCAAGVGAPHIRQRLWFVGVAGVPVERRLGRRAGEAGNQPGEVERSERLCDAGRLDHHHHQGPQGHAGDDGAARGRQEPGRSASETGISGGLADTRKDRDRQHARKLPSHEDQHEVGPAHGDHPPVIGGAARERQPGPTNGLWRDADWLGCRDERWRPVEPGTFPLVNGAPSRVGRLRAYGNAIVAEAAATFIGAVIETSQC